MRAREVGAWRPTNRSEQRLRARPRHRWKSQSVTKPTDDELYPLGTAGQFRGAVESPLAK